jgi:hypothetical protein
MAAWLLSAIALSAWPAASGRSLAAAACATTTVAGPFLLLRARQALATDAVMTGAFVIAGALLFLLAFRGALSAEGSTRWRSFAARAPAGLTLVAVGAGGPTSGAQVMIGSGVLAAAVHLALGGDEVESSPLDDTSPLMSLMSRLGELVGGMDRWVVGAAVDAAAWAARAAAWVVAWQDEHAIGTPGNAAARRVVHVARGVEPIFGATPGSVAWWTLGVVAALALICGLWPSAS